MSLRLLGFRLRLLVFTLRLLALRLRLLAFSLRLIAFNLSLLAFSMGLLGFSLHLLAFSFRLLAVIWSVCCTAACCVGCGCQFCFSPLSIPTCLSLLVLLLLLQSFPFRFTFLVSFLILLSSPVFSLFRFSICCIAESSFELFAGRRLYFSLAFPNAQSLPQGPLPEDNVRDRCQGGTHRETMCGVQ